jgi:DNA adenine methylase
MYCIRKVQTAKKAKGYIQKIHPPYINSDQGHYGGYTENDFIDLLDVCKSLKGKFLLSNYNSDILTDYIKSNGWYKREITSKLSGSKSLNSRRGREAAGKTHKTEVLVSNYASPCGTLKLF